MRNETVVRRDAGQTTPARHRPPRLALVLGWAGVVPFAGLAVAIALGRDVPLIENEAMAMAAYGAIILSFMAGVHWGLAMRASDAPDGPLASRLLALSVVPAILAWFTLLLPAVTALVVLALLFVALLPLDLWAISERLAPAWYRPLRLQLTAAVVASLAIAAASV